MKTVGLYARVSTGAQSVEMQLRELTAAAERHCWKVAGEYVDDGISGTKGRDQRPAFDKLCKAIARHEFDIVAAWSIDRIARSMQHLVGFAGEVEAAGVDLYIERQGLNTMTPKDKAFFYMSGIFAELERALIVERVRSGIAKAQATGTRSGKAIGRPPVPADKIAAIRAALATGDGIRKVARLIGVGNETVHKIAREMRAALA